MEIKLFIGLWEASVIPNLFIPSSPSSPAHMADEIAQALVEIENGQGFMDGRTLGQGYREKSCACGWAGY